MTWQEILIVIILALIFVQLIVLLVPLISKLSEKINKSKRESNVLSSSSKIRLINQLREAIEYLSQKKIGAIITIENNDNLDNLRTDGVKIDANISSSLIISIFNKNSPLHDGAIIIRSGKIVYASTYYKISKKSIDNKYGSRHRAGLGISEVSDATTIVVSEETGDVSITKNSMIIPIKMSEFQEKLIFFLKD
ncbi:MAG: diadenylate cyclase [Mycoplasmataceae bacterium]|nr:diadenylate cyclase [Mycoplasmataceae bacterium]MBR2055495.1 diadenylate cyclase [Mycoplasmataceae bacterium]MBR3571421.1 diadenylate cyclase [Mycoplasmataceae bacterium]MBR3832291.1 diadenylate cyclase [Mycoplasmataceae bacterium]MBR4025859.1 diadenylate cyclase [Mycoplasmataceae bacterium]